MVGEQVPVEISTPPVLLRSVVPFGKLGVFSFQGKGTWVSWSGTLCDIAQIPRPGRLV